MMENNELKKQIMLAMAEFEKNLASERMKKAWAIRKAKQEGEKENGKV